MLTKLKIGAKILCILLILTKISLATEAKLIIFNNLGKKQKSEYILKVNYKLDEAELYIDGKNISIKNKTTIKKTENGHIIITVGNEDILHFLNFTRKTNGGNDLIFREKVIDGKLETIGIPSRYYIKKE